MSREDDDIIELGEDGSFDISSTTAIQQPKSEGIDYSKYDWGKIEMSEKLNIVNALKPNEFAIYASEDKKSLWVTAKLGGADSLKEVQLMESKAALRLVTLSGSTLQIQLPQTVDEKSVSCKVCKDLVTILATVKPLQ
jgi:hypothetical protein